MILLFQTGDFDLSKEVTDIIDEPLMNCVDQSINVSKFKPQPRPGKHYDTMKKMAATTNMEDEEDEDFSPSYSPTSVDGPHSLEVAAKKISNDKTSPMKKIVDPLPVTSFRPGPLSKNIFVEAIQDIGAKYLTSLKNAPFPEVEKRYQEASTVYKGIENLKGDPSPLKQKVDSYVSSVKSYLALECAAAKRKHPTELEQEIANQAAKVSQAESELNIARANQDALTEKRSVVESKIASLEVELRNAREEEHRLVSDFESSESLISEAETRVAEEKQVLAEVEANQTLTCEEVAEMEQHKNSLLEYQSTLNPTEWMDIA